jgi:hypothetical protein
MTNLIKINPSEFGLQEEQAETILSGLKQILIEREIQLTSFEVENISTLQLSTMSADVFDAFLNACKSKFEAKKEAERIAELKRLEEIEAEKQRIEAQRIENERLKAESEKREKEIEAERKIQAAILEAEKAKAEAERQAENERIANELKAKKEAEKLAKAPIKKQLFLWVESFELPAFATKNETAQSIFDKFEGFKKWAENEINNL